MKNNVFKKMLSLLLALSVVFSMLSGVIIPISAEYATDFDLEDTVEDTETDSSSSESTEIIPDTDIVVDSETEKTENFSNTVIINNGSGEGNNIFSSFDDSLFVSSTINNTSADGKALTLMTTAEVTGKKYIQLKADTSGVKDLKKIQAISFYIEIPEGEYVGFDLFANNEHYELIGNVYAIGTDGTIFNNVTNLDGFKGTIVYVLPKNGWDSVLMEFEDRGDILNWTDFVEYEGFESFGCCIDFVDNAFSKTLVFDELAVHYDAEKLLDDYDILSEHKYYSDYTYILKNGEVTINDVDTAISGEIAVPSTMFDKPVTKIADFAFANCSAITGIFLPDSITSIGYCAFEGCTALTNIIIPKTVTSLGSSVFDNCSALTDIYYLGTEDVWNDLTAPIIIPATATVHFLGNGSAVSDFEYTLANDMVTITGYNGASGVVSIPKMIENRPVKKIATSAFINKSNITDIIIPFGLFNIEDFAFWGCTGLTNVYIPSSVTYIGYNIFKNCSNLKNIDVASDNQDYCAESGILYNKLKTQILSYPCAKAGEYKMPDTVTWVYPQAFWNCYGITDITFSNKLTKIDEFAFFQCIGLNNVVIPNGTETIGANAFASCYNLKNVVIPNSVTTIGANAFEGCTEIKGIYYLGSEEEWASVAIDSTNEVINSSAIQFIENGVYSDGLIYTIENNEAIVYKYICGSDIVIPEEIKGCPVTAINDIVFNGCTDITSVVISNSVKTIGSSAFFGCSGLTSIVLPEKATSIGANAFSGCTNITNITIPDGITNIGNNTFNNCTKLTTVTIPDSVVGIGDRAFLNCSALTDVYYGGTEEQWNTVTIGSNNSPLTNAIKHFKLAESDFADFEYTINDTDGVVAITGYIGDGGEVVIPSVIEGYPVTCIDFDAFYGCDSVTSIIVPNSVTTIGDGAFAYCTSLESITIPQSVESIGFDAFTECNNLININVDGNNSSYTSINGVLFNKDETALIRYPAKKAETSYEIPESVTVIKDNAFKGCTCLISIIIPQGVNIIGPNAFSGCTSLKNITIPDNIVVIEDFIFSYCTSLESITIPQSVKNIGAYVFYNCIGLTDVYYNGTSAQWNEITLGSNNEPLTSATIHFTECAECVFGEWIVRTSATCTADGLRYRVCSNCGREETEVISAGHSFSDWSYGCLHEPDSAGGMEGEFPELDEFTLLSSESIYSEYYISRRCSVCGEYERVAVDESEVPFIIETVEPTCTTDGYTTKTCPYCYTVVYTEYFAAYVHVFSEWDYYCNHGGGEAELPDLDEFALMSVEDYSEYYRTHYCYNCGYEETEYLSTDEVPFIIETVEPTCTSDGYTTYTCPYCHTYSFIDNYIVGSGHTYGDWEFECEHYWSSPIPGMIGGEELFHRFTKRRSCLNCGLEETESALAGEYGFHTTVVNPTCHSQGYKVDICPCGQQFEYDYTPALEHSYSATVYPPSCDCEGYTEHYCSLCGDYYYIDYVPAIGHNYYTEYISEPDCDNNGYTYKICSNCGQGIYEDYVDALGHNYSSVVTQPDCFNEGYTTHTCSRCSYTYTDNYVNAISNHNFITNPASDCDENKYICSICGVPCADIYTKTGNKISNDNLVFAVNGNRFALHTTGGDPDITTDDNAKLLYGDITGGTSSTYININGSIYRFEGEKNLINSTGDSIYSYATFNGVFVQRYCNFVYNIYTQRYDTLEIKLVFTNISTSDKTAGTRIFFDTMLGSNDSAPFRVPGKGDITSEKEYSGDNIPQIWQVFNSLSSPTVFASGTFYENIADRPDKIQFITYGNGSYTSWDCSISGSYFGDSAVNIYYNPVALSSGNSRIVGTFYGLSEFASIEEGELKASVVAPSELLLNDANNAYRNNPFTVNGWIINENSSKTLSNVKLKLQLPEGLVAVDQALELSYPTFAPNSNQAFAWQITALPKYRATQLTYTIILSADDTEDKIYTYTVNIPALPASLCPHEAQGEWIIDSNPTCDTDGSKHRVCGDCDTVETVVLDAIGHNYSDWNLRCFHEFDPLHSITGGPAEFIHIYERYKVCYTCGKEDVETLDNSEFVFIEYITDPTCTEEGYTTYLCPLCEHFSYTDNFVPPTGHSYEMLIIEPTYFEQGYTTYICIVCNHSYTGDYVPALERKDISQADLSLEFTHAFYKGVAITPDVYYIDASGNLSAIDGEFTVEYLNNNKVGTATAIITGINEFTGTKELYFEIVYEVIPEKITNFVAIGEIGKISLSWSQSIEVNTNKYNIYRKADDEAEFVLIKTVIGRNNLSFEDTNVEREKTYSYYVTGVGLYDAESEASQIASATVDVDRQAPSVLKVNPSSGSVLSGQMTLYATANDNVGVVKAEYYYSTDDGASWNAIGVATNRYLSVTFDTSLLTVDSVKVKVIVFDAEGNQSDDYIVSYSLDNVGPDKVTGLAAVTLSSKITLTWNDVSANDAASFTLQIKKNGVWTVVSRGITTKGYTLTNLQPDTEYTFKVACVDVYGNVGEYSDEFTAKTLADTTAPVITAQSPASGRYNSSIRFAATAKDDCDIEKIEIQVSTDLISWTTLSTKTFTDKYYSGSYAYTINLSGYSDGSIFVRAIATDFSGNVSDMSDAAPYTEFIVDRTAPAAPQNVSANGNDGYITVAWSMGAEYDLGKYFVYRATSADGEYVLIASNLSSLNYHDRSIQRGTEYYYKVRVSDSCGNMSDYSSFVSATMTPDSMCPQITSISSTYQQKISNSSHTIKIGATDNNKLSYVVVEYYTSGNADYVQLVKKENINSHYIDFTVELPISGLADGEFIIIRAYAVDVAGLRSDYETSKYTFDNSAPQIDGFNAVIDGKNVTLSWKDCNESDLSGFRIYRSADGISYTLLGSRGVNYTGEYSFIDTISSQYDVVYIYKLVAVDRVGNSTSALTNVEYKYVYVNTPPVAEMNIPAYITVGVEEQFDASSSSDNIKIVKYHWDFGDGTTSADIKPIKKYTNVGVYTVTLTVTDNEGLTATRVGTVEVKERELLGNLNVKVVDETGKTLSYVPVYFDLGSENQKIIYTNSSGIASLQLSTGTHIVGMYASGYLPVKKEVVVLASATRTITLTTVEEDIVTGEFEVTRMTFDEIIAAGIDVHDPANQNVYSATVRVTYTSSAPLNISYIRNDDRIIDYTITDSNGRPAKGYTNGNGEYRVITGVTFIPSGSGAGEVVAIMDIPASASYLKEFFDVKLHIVNNASSDFVLEKNEVELHVPNGMTLMQSVKGEYLTSNKAYIESIRGQQTVTLAWVLRGDKAGEYHLSADFIGTLAEFNEIVSAQFKTKEPIKVYGLEGVKFRILTADKILNEALYFNVELENQRDIDIYMPSIGVTDKIFNVTESVLNNNSSGDFTAKAYVLNIYIQNENGSKIYIPVKYDSNGKIVTDIKVLAPGQKLVYEYVVYNAINYAGVAYFKEAAIIEFEGLIENIETGSFHKDFYSFNDYSAKLDSILNGGDEKVNNAFDYVMTDDNYYYMIEADKLSASVCEVLFKVANTILNFDVSAFTQDEERELIKQLILSILAESSVIEQADDLVSVKYNEAVIDMIEKIRDGVLDGVFEDEDTIANVGNAFADMIKDSKKLALVYKNEGYEGFVNELNKQLLGYSLGVTIDVANFLTSDDALISFSDVFSFGKDCFTGFFKAVNESERDYYYYSILKLQCNAEVSARILDAIIEIAEVNNESLIKSIATSLRKDLDTSMEEYRKDMNLVGNLFEQGAVIAAEEAIEFVVKRAIGSTTLGLVSAGFNILDAVFGWGDYVKQQDTFDVYAALTETFITMFSRNISVRNLENDFYTMLYLRAVCEFRLSGEDQFKKFMKDYMDGVYLTPLSEEEVMDKINKVKNTSFKTFDEWTDDFQYKIVSARDILFNTEYASMPDIPRAPVVTLDYDLLQTVQSFTNDYEYCFADGVWYECTNAPIKFTVGTVPSVIRVRKKAGYESLAGEITTVKIFARKDLSKLISVKFDGVNYLFDNLSSERNYQVVFINSAEEEYSWSNAVTISGADDIVKLSGVAEFDYIVIRSCQNSQLNETTSNPLVVKVSKKHALTLIIDGNGSVAQPSVTGHYFIGEDINLTATANTGCEFIGWYINGILVSSDAVYIAEMSEGLNIKAEFSGAKLTGITIITLPTKLSYYEGEELNLTGMVVSALYSDGSSAVIDQYTAYIASNTVGTSSVIVTFGDMTASFDIEINHKPGEWITVSPATHFNDGLKVKKCTICSAVIESEVIPKVEHIYIEKTVSPNCTEYGYTEYTCICGYTYKDNFVEPNGHVYSGKWTVDVEPTLTTEGSKSRHCLYCDSVTNVTVIPALGFAFEYEVVDGEAVITGYNGTKTEVTIPSELDGYVVTKIADDAFYNNKNITRITIPETIEYIGYWAFDNCDNITVVNYQGTAEQWSDIEICYGNLIFGTATINYLGGIICGDVNDDGKVDSIDLAKLRKLLLDSENYDDIMVRIDTNGDTKFDIRDLVRLKKYLADADVDLGGSTESPEPSDDIDTDEDGLTDIIEKQLGTSTTSADTDQDGLNDYTEVAVMSYNPLSKDTDNDGIFDGFEDYDNDGIDNLTEIEIGTDLSLADTDGDALNDKTEIEVYNTKPLDSDTDNDGVSDGKEIEMGTDPLVAQTVFNTNLSADDTDDVVTPSVEIELSGEQVETLRIDSVDDENLFPETMPGYMGKAYDFNVDGDFPSATISFEFDEALLEDGSEPVICYFNEETQELEELETTISGNVASATVTHFSKYILIDRKVYNESFVWTDVWESDTTYSGVEIILIIDDSGSMDWNDEYNQRLEVAKTLIDKLPQNSKIGVVKFESSTTKLTTSITTDKDLAKSYLNTSYFRSNGGTYMYTAINSSFSMFESSDADTMKMMVVLSDGESSGTSNHNSTINNAKSNGVKIYTVGLGDSTSYFNSYLKPLASNTGGAFYLASDAEQLTEIYKNISNKIDIETDSDSDGIPDYYEDNMICFNGVKLALDKNNPDTDGDGIKDGEEIELKYEYNSDRSRVKVTGKIIKGNPINKDSDGDGYIDNVDENPLKWDVSDRDLVMCASMSYSYIPKTTALNDLSNTLKGEIENRFKDAATIKELDRWSVVDTWYAGGGLQAVAFKVDSNIIVTYRGTDEGVDWFNNATTYILGISTHTVGAKKFIRKIMSSYRGYNIYVTGHSLGGHLAYNAAAEGINYNKSSIKGIVTFNGLGLTIGLTLFGDIWDEALLLKKPEVIRNYSVEGDPVSKGFLGFTTFHYGTTYTYAQSSKAPDAHNLYTFLEVLEPTSRYNYYR